MSRFVLTAQLQLQAPNNVAQVVRQIQSQLNGVNINLNVQNSAQAQRQLQQVTAQTQAATSAADRMGRAFALSIRRFAAFSIATRAVSLFTSTLSSAVDTAIDFERQMIKISQVTGDSMQKLRGLTKSITDLSTGLGVSSQSLLEASTLLLQAGISAKDTEVALKTLAKAALAPNFDSLSETTEGAIAILAQFGEGVGALEKQLGAINAVAGAFAVEAGDLIDVIRRAGGVFKSSGGDLNELIALFTSVRATTRESAESIGTGLRTIFTRIQRPKTIEFLKQFGVELVDLNGKFVGPYEAVKKLSEALSGLGEGDITFIRIAEELGGFRQIGKVLPLLQQFTVAQNALNVANKAGNSLTNDAATAQQALAIRILKVKEEFLALVRGMTETQTFQIMANTALSLASALIKIGEAIKPLLPLLAAVAAVNFAKGIGTFAGGLMRGMQSGRTYNKGGKVHHFARGGMVPGSGNRDTVPAMLQPGEFVIRKSSVNKLGAGNLAAMNENRYEYGGAMTTAQKLAAARLNKNTTTSNKPTKDIKSLPIKTPKFGTESEVGIATTSYLPLPVKGSITVDRADIINQSIGDLGFKLSTKYGKNALSYISKVYKGKPKLSYGTVAEGVGLDEEAKFKTIIDESIGSGVDIASSRFAKEILGSSLATPVPKLPSFYKTLDQGFRGQLFENVISSMSGKPLSGQDSRRPFDFTRGIGKFKSIYSNLGMDYVDAKITAGAAGLKSTGFGTEGISGLTNKILGQLAKEAIPAISLLERQAGEIGTLTTQGKALEKNLSPLQKSIRASKKHFGGIISKFALGGIAKAPLIDDIINASGTVMPRPSSAIASLIRAGGGAIDIDRTLKRTLGDQAYGRAKTSGQQSAALDKYFRDPAARLRDVKSAPLTAFGKELQAAIKSGQLQPGRLSIVSKSQRVPGVAEYLSQLFGIPLANMIFTQGGSKQPAMDALRTKGPRANRVARFATGGGVGTDTVPALLTPGEFVVNRASAQRIGYGNLHRMNKVGKYARGGIVQHFGQGGVTATPARSRSNPSTVAFVSAQSLTQNAQAIKQNTQNVVQNTQAQNSEAKSAMDVVNNNKMFAATMATSLIGGFLPAIDESSSGILKVTHYMLGLATTLTSVMFALEAFGVALNAKTIMQLFGSGPGGLGSIIKNAFSGFKMGAAGMAGPMPLGGGMASRIGGMFGAGKAAIGSRFSKASDLISGFGNTKLARGFSAGLSGKSVIGSGSKSIAANIGGFAGQGVLGAKKLGSSVYSAANLDLIQPSFSLGRQGKRLTQLGSGNSLSSFNPKNFAPKLANFAGRASTSQFAQGLGAGFTEKNLSFGKILGSGRGISAKAGGLLGRGAGLVSQGVSKVGGLAARAGGAVMGGLGSAGSAAMAAAGPIAAITGLVAIVNGAVGAFKDLDGQLQKSIQAGKIEEASRLAVAKAAADFPLIGNLVSGWSDAVDSWLIYFGQAFGGSTIDSVKALASSQAGAVKTQKQLEQAQKTASNAMEDFENGSISAAEALSRIRAASSEVVNQEKRASDFAKKNLQNRASDGFTGRNIASFLTFGAVESSSQRNERLGKQSAEQISQASKFQNEAFQLETGARTANIKSGFARGLGLEEIRNQALGVGTDNDLQKRLEEQVKAVSTLQDAGDKVGADAAMESVNQLTAQINQVNREMVNLEKEVARSKAAFEAMNLGLRGPTATATAMSASMDRFASGLEVGGSAFVANAEFLSQAMSSAAQAMNPEDIKRAIDDVSKNLQNMGVDPAKFRANIEGFIKVQQDYTKSFANVRSNLQARLQAGQKNADSADEVRKALIKELTAGLEGDAKKNITAILDNLKLEQADIDKFIATGDFSAFGDQITEAGRKQVEEIMKISQERYKAEQVLIGFIKQRGEAERNLAAAQKESIDLFMEGRDVQAKYGGQAVTTQEKRASVVAKANAGAGIAGLGAMRTGSIAELRARNAQTLAGFGRIEERRSVQGGMELRGGAEAANTQQNLQQAQKDQIQTIRDLIKIEEEELKIIQEKNKMEKDSLEALISGDVEKFFENQAAMGAQASIAAGDTNAANMFGAKAVGQAFQDIQRQMEAGVQSMFGRQLGGAGGLAEQAAGAALGARGVMDPRMAQRLAGTTAAEEQSKATLRELGKVLGETGMVGEAMASMEVQTANINVTNATLELASIEERGRQAAQAAGMYRGGTVYANRGVFVPRGTDTVPAMLTPGEFVVRREAVNRGNNLQLLRAINSGNSSAGMARGGKVGYYNNGGVVQYKALGDLVANLGKSIGIDPQLISNLGNVFNSFIGHFNESIKNLQNTKVQVQMAPTTVNVNFTGANMLNQISGEAKTELIKEVIQTLKNQYGIGSNGKFTENNSNLARPGQGS